MEPTPTGVWCDESHAVAPVAIITPPSAVYHIPAHYTDGLPAKTCEHYERSYRDPLLLSIRDNIALLQARRAQLLLRIEFGDSVQWREELAEQWGELKAAVKTDDADSLRDALNTMGRLIEGGSNDDQVWKDIQEVDRDLVKWKEAEHRRESDLKVTLSLADAAAMVVKYHAAVMSVVVDVGQRRDIEAEYATLFRDAVASADRAMG